MSVTVVGLGGCCGGSRPCLESDTPPIECWVTFLLHASQWLSHTQAYTLTLTTAQLLDEDKRGVE